MRKAFNMDSGLATSSVDAARAEAGPDNFIGAHFMGWRLSHLSRKRLDDDICARIDHQDAIPLIDVAIRRRGDDRRSDRRRCDRIVERTSVTHPIIIIRRLAISRIGNNRCRAGVTIERRLRIGIRGEATYGGPPRHDLAACSRPCRWTDGPHRLDSFDCPSPGWYPDASG